MLRVTYELYVVLLIQQEVFYLQIPARQREKTEMSMLAECLCLHQITYLSRHHHTMHKQERSVVIKPLPIGQNTDTHTLPMWVTAADFLGSIVYLLIPT